MLRKLMLASIAAASFGVALAAISPSAQAEYWRGSDDGYGRSYHDRPWRRWHWRHHHGGYGERHGYGPPAWRRRWHWRHHYGRAPHAYSYDRPYW